ncbi:NAD(P)(+)--arginine ADP-ribosyltransferase 2-like isoform X1 [Esox lucius]|nr:NAD(P)(+)--arginine ADP-ribosyltransferase 2-like isoform X1 [Esox lucius]
MAKDKSLMFVVLYLIHVWTLGVDSITFPLGMTPDSIDDKYDKYSSCRDVMYGKVNRVYLPDEKKANPEFNSSWMKAEEEWKKTVLDDSKLTREQFIAIYVYTNPSTSIFSTFNTIVRDGSAPFKYHSLHFFLTDAIRTLNKGCENTYRRTTVDFNPKLFFRFGTFTSSSRSPNITTYGNVSCFSIKTCYGAYLEPYTATKEEEEVLIPPYEVFKVTNVQQNPPKNEPLGDCKVVYTVESIGVQSNFNCKLLNKAGSNRSSNKGYIMLYIMLIISVHF